jgi:hypothetical protein
MWNVDTGTDEVSTRLAPDGQSPDYGRGVNDPGDSLNTRAMGEAISSDSH